MLKKKKFVQCRLGPVFKGEAWVLEGWECLKGWTVCAHTHKLWGLNPSPQLAASDHGLEVHFSEARSSLLTGN
jgi:hypothetical protein